MLARGATQVIVGSALFSPDGIDLDRARELSTAVGAAKLIAAVDSRGGQVVIHGWRTQLTITPVEAVRQLEPFVGEFLYTHVDREGLMKGTDMEAIAAVRAATTPPGDGGRRHHHPGRDRAARCPRRRRRRRHGDLYGAHDPSGRVLTGGVGCLPCVPARG